MTTYPDFLAMSQRERDDAMRRLGEIRQENACVQERGARVAPMRLNPHHQTHESLLALLRNSRHQTRLYAAVRTLEGE